MPAWTIAPVPLLVATPAAIVQVRHVEQGSLSYVIGSEGEAAVVDPSVDPVVYADIASEHGWTITAVLETDVDDDRIERALKLGGLMGAHVHLPSRSRVAAPYTPFAGGETLTIGRAVITAIDIEGPALRRCYLIDRAALCTGDAPSDDAMREQLGFADARIILLPGSDDRRRT